jgi:hypothetical protein
MKGWRGVERGRGGGGKEERRWMGSGRGWGKKTGERHDYRGTVWIGGKRPKYAVSML